MVRLDPEKLHVVYLSGCKPGDVNLPRRYTLTHSDITGELFLSIGSEYNTAQLSGFCIRLMRDEVLGELSGNGDDVIFNLHCHVSGGFVIGTARLRYWIFQHELPLALESIRYGDRALFEKNPELDNAPLVIHFKFANSRYNRVENWGTIGQYR